MSNDEESSTKKSWKQYFAFLKNPNFYKVLFLGQCKSKIKTCSQQLITNYSVVSLYYWYKCNNNHIG